MATPAKDDSAVWQFHAGRTAFEGQNYAAALEAFEAAADAGLPGPTVHFNIGVTAFRLGRYTRAESAFREVARTPEMAALAHYNLGLVALRRGDRDVAARWFESSAEEATDERLRELATTKLAEIGPPPSDRNWIGYAALAAGHDDNVALIANSDVLGVSDTADSFADLQLAFAAPLTGPWRFDAGLAATNYQELDAFDVLSVQGGGRYRLRQDSSTHELGLQLGYSTLDGEGFESKRMLVLQSSTALRSCHLRARYRFSDVEGLGDFERLSGQRHEASVRCDKRYELWDFGFEYQFEAGDYEDAALSATRHQVGVDLRRMLPADWMIGLEASRRHSRYDDDTNGTEERTELALSTARALNAQWRLIMRYAYADNEAEQAEFDYTRSRISVGVESVW